MTEQLDKWKGQFGDDYTNRNEDRGPTVEQRMALWHGILLHTANNLPEEILEVGANIGENLTSINNIFQSINKQIKLFSIEPNDKARNKNPFQNVLGDIFNIGCPNHSINLVFTCGVLIHIHPDDLINAMKEMYRVSNKYLLSVEYFSPKCEEIKYRGENNMLWKNDFGSVWLDNFPLRCIGYGFSWKRMSGLDNLTWWLMEKVH